MRSKDNSTTAPHPALESTSNVAPNSFVQVVQDDTSATVLPNLLVAVQQVTLLVTTLALAMLQAYVDIRFRQAKAKRRLCEGCAEPMESHTHAPHSVDPSTCALRSDDCLGATWIGAILAVDHAPASRP